jgi:signal transduction histidine kinase
VNSKIYIFTKSKKTPQLQAICAELPDLPIWICLFSETSISIEPHALVIVNSEGPHEELIRICTEIRTKNSYIRLIAVGRQIPASAVFFSKINLALQPEELSLLPDVINEIDATKMGGTNSMDELQKKNSELEKINFELDRFVYSASHDLRSPLTSVLGLLYLLRSEVNENHLLHYVSLMEESILKLDNIIRDIVAYSRNNRTQIQLEEFTLKELLNDVNSGLRYLENGEFELDNVIRLKGSKTMVSDRNRLQIILNNLISNSIKYRHPSRKPEITLDVATSGKGINIDLSDNGIGIPENQQDKIFDMFYRSNDKSSGSGLGLYIVRETVKKLDGSISVQSEVNTGTQFHISLPNTLSD